MAESYDSAVQLPQTGIDSCSDALRQIDVFGARPFLGNPLAVVLDAEGLSTEEMQRFARWMHLSETAFILPPRDETADYRIRIFTLTSEVPFAGHPTLGSCHAWLSSGAEPKHKDRIVQECEAGLISTKRSADELAFAAPPLYGVRCCGTGSQPHQLHWTLRRAKRRRTAER